MPDRSPTCWLLAVAAPAEARAVLRGLGASEAAAGEPWTRHQIHECIDLVVTGIGKANAAGAVGRFADPARHDAILSLGVAGALPDSGLSLGQSLGATACHFADEGLATPDGFLDCERMGFPLGGFSGSAVPVDAAVLGRLRSLVDVAGPIATVSTCSGTGALAAQVRQRTSALAEAMEGAAVALVAHRLGIRVGELRIISNTTGDRSGQTWDLKGALAALERVTGRLAALLLEWPSEGR